MFPLSCNAADDEAAHSKATESTDSNALSNDDVPRNVAGDAARNDALRSNAVPGSLRVQVPPEQ